MSNSDSPSLGFPAAPPSPSHKPTDLFGESFDESEFQARWEKSIRATDLSLIDMKKMNHKARKVLGLTTSESHLSVVPESVFLDSETTSESPLSDVPDSEFVDSGSETFIEAPSGEGNRGGEVKAMEAVEDGKGEGEADPEFSMESWDDYVKGLPDYVLEMYQILLPKFFPRN